MKKSQIISGIVLLAVLAGCSGGTKQVADELITVDVTVRYPKKELTLQDFMDVEYVPLETTDDFITMGWLHSVGKNLIIVRNRNRATDGDIYLFDRSGKALRKINRLGQGSEEYLFLLGITLDEAADEIFVNDHWNRKIQVYDLSGNFKRTLAHLEGRQYAMDIYDFDRENLICRDMALDHDLKENRNVFLVISKQDGSITREIELPFKEKVSSNVIELGVGIMPIRNRTLVPLSSSSWSLMETSTDTVYRYNADHTMTPLIVRKPAIASMSPGVFLYPAVMTDQYCFMQTVKAEWDWEKNVGHERINLMYDKQADALYECTVYNADMTNKEPVIMTSEITYGDDEIAFVRVLEAFDLIEANEEGKLKGRLKEIAETLEDDSNPVMMLVKYKIR